MKRIGILVQARAGSTRLPGKMLKPFYLEDTIPRIILEKLKRVFPLTNIVLCTTQSPSDDVLESLAQSCGVRCFRGDEDDVLKRFIDASESYGFEEVVRVCADNPFLSQKHLRTLVEEFESRGCDYLSYAYFDGTPIMKGHVGLFAEAMRTDFLRRIYRVTTLPIYREHVTNYVYEHLSEFDAQFLLVPAPFTKRKDIRLTIDTESDFIYIQEIYAATYAKLQSSYEDVELQNLFDIVHSTPEVLAKMKIEIEKNTK